MNADQLIARYIQLRDFVEKRSKEHAEELAPYNAALKAIENAGSALLIEQGGDAGKANIVTPSGTMYRKKWVSLTMADRAAWMDFVIADWDAREKFLTSAVTKSEIEEWIEVEKAVPPGLNRKTGYDVYFNRPK
jgi:hypothetical protein